MGGRTETNHDLHIDANGYYYDANGYYYGVFLKLFSWFIWFLLGHIWPTQLAWD